MTGKFLGAAIFIAAMGCTAITTTTIAQDNAIRSGEDIYNDKCVYCHSSRGWGTRVLSRRTPEGQAELTQREALPAAYTAIVVRQGLGSMPAFTPTELSDEEIAEVARWLEGAN